MEAYQQQCSDEIAERFSCTCHERILQTVVSPVHTAFPSAFHVPLNSAGRPAAADGRLLPDTPAATEHVQAE